MTLPNGDVVAGGSFLIGSGHAPVAGLARFDVASGTWSIFGSFASEISSPTVLALSVTHDGDLIVGGRFSSIGTSSGQPPLARLARYRPSTNQWFALPVPPFDGEVTGLAALPSGKVLAIGSFNRASLGESAALIEIDLSTNTSSTVLGLAPGGSVQAITAHGPNEIVIGGRFEVMQQDGSRELANIARYDLITRTWTPSALPSTVSLNRINAIAALSNGDLAVGGDFTGAASHLIRFRTATRSWEPFRYPPASEGVGGRVLSITSVDGVEILVGGIFRVVGGGASRAFGGAVLPGDNAGVSATGIARLNTSTMQWQALGSGVSSRVTALHAVRTGTIVASDFTQMNGTMAELGLNLLNSQFGRLTKLGPPGSMIDGPILAISETSNGNEVLIGGTFTTIAGLNARGLVRLNVVQGTFSLVPGWVGGNVSSLKVRPSSLGRVVVGGEFQQVGSISVNNIAELNLVNGTWSALEDASGPSVVNGVVGKVYALANVRSDNLIVAGALTSAGGRPARGLARYNFQTRQWTPLNLTWRNRPVTFHPDNIAPLEVLSSNTEEFFVGGAWFEDQNQTFGPVVHVNLTTNQVRPFGDTAARINALAGLGVDLYVAGQFESIAGLPSPNIARFNTLANIWFSVGSGVSSSTTGPAAMINSLVVQRNVGFLHVGGTFTTAGTIDVNNLAQFRGSSLSTVTIPGFAMRLVPDDCGTRAVTLRRTRIVANTQESVQWLWRPVTNSSVLLPWKPVVPGVNAAPVGDFAGGGQPAFMADPGTELKIQNIVARDADNASVQREFRYLVTDVCGTLSSSSVVVQHRLADFDCNRIVDQNDLFLFLNGWFAGSPTAQLDPRRGVGAMPEVGDVFLFLDAWFRGLGTSAF